MIITIVGGGSTFTPGIVKSIALRKDELEVDEIRLFDIDRERQDKLGVLVKWILEEDLKSGIKLTVTYDEKEAYTDADFIFAQMRVGKYAMREQDEKIPLKHGCVGQETCGCGGMAYGMRTIFPMIKVIDDVEKYAKPTYWILNYSNPASIVSEACRKLRPNARIINICDMPIAIIDVVAAALEVNKKDLVYDYYGLNHFGWFTSIEYKGEDVMPKLRDYIMDQEILLPAAYLKDKGALTSSGSGGNRHTADPQSCQDRCDGNAVILQYYQYAHGIDYKIDYIVEQRRLRHVLVGTHRIKVDDTGKRSGNNARQCKHNHCKQ